MPINGKLIAGVDTTARTSGHKPIPPCVRAGQIAYQKGLSLHHNPYDIRTESKKHYEWTTGFKGMKVAMEGIKV